MAVPKLSVIIPCYNEEKRIVETLKYTINYLKPQPYSWEIIVVDDSSRDQTSRVVKDLQIPNVKVIRNDPNLGKGGSVKRGMLTATGEYRLFCDADNATPFEEIGKFWPVINEKNVAIGSRYIKGSNIVAKQTFLRRFLSRMGNLLVQLVLLPGLPDTQCGFKMFTAGQAEKIFPRQTINRWGFDMEVLYIARKFGFKVKQVPVTWYDRAGSTMPSSGAFSKTLAELFKIRWGGFVGRYR